MITFANWYMLLFIPLVIYLFFLRRKQSALKFSNVKLLRTKHNQKNYIYRCGRYIILIAFIILVCALARPRILESEKPITEKGIDIAMLLDVSGSMESVDFKPSRLEVAKKNMDDFVSKRANDRVALVVFAGNAYTRVPLTLDHAMVKKSIVDISRTSVKEQGTAIGMAMAVGLNRLKKSDSASKIMILLTDGDNNAGSIDPVTATGLAKDLGIKVYTIAVGSDKTLLPTTDIFGDVVYREIDGGFNEELLKQISDDTGGKYYRAKDQETLKKIFTEIDTLEKSKFNQDNFREYNELAFILIKIALVLLVIGIYFDRYYFIQIP